MNPPNTTPLNEEDRLGEIKAVVRDGLANHTGEFANPWIFKGSYSHELLADILNDIMASERLFKNLTNLIQTLEKKAVENARSKDPFKCEFGHQVYSHNTADGWCCACDADIAFLNRQITQLQGVENETK